MSVADEFFEQRLHELAAPRPGVAIFHAGTERALRAHVRDGKSLRTHASDGHEIALVTEGHAHVVTASETFHLLPGRLLFINRGVEHAEVPCPSQVPYRMFWCLCDSTFARLDQTAFSPPGKYLSGPAAELPGRTSILSIADAIALELEHRDCDWERAVNSLLSYLSCILVRRLRRGEVLRLRPRESPTICAEPRIWGVIQAALQYCDANFRSPLRVTDVARAMGYSPNHLSHLFSTYVGHSLADHIRTLRLDAAQALLETSELSISEIARSVGYGDPAHFTRAFTRAHDLSPKAYRERLRGL